MGDQIAIEFGLPPWSPARDAELIKTYNFYDVPLIGILRQGGMDHLFLCLEGEVEPVSLWVYTRLEVRDIEQIESAPDIRMATLTFLMSRPVLVAIAKEDEGIVAAEYIQHPERHEDLFQAVLAANASLARDLEQLRAI